ncbi:ATP-dependent RNA helicase DHX58-like [Ptychodera flava]|uniref:ATP-dependent RNA helicase DHX58-like n=1 Tax=Ptychodera flava TaxID=63121 RepID=UPI00396A4573
MENKGDEFRGIVFVKSQNVARAVHRMLQEDEHLQNLKPILSLGAEQEQQNDGITDASVTALQEPNIMKEFSAGSHKLIVTTGGIETKLGTGCICNTIVWYGHVDNVISTKQITELLISGESIVYFIGDQATSMRADVNTLLDQEVDRAIQEIHSMSEEEYDMEISKIQKRKLEERHHKEFTEHQKRDTYPANVIKLNCVCCKTFVCLASDVHKYGMNNHIIINDNIIRSKVEFKEHRDPAKKKLGLKKIYCKYCGQDWGNTLKPPKCFPNIKIESFQIEYDDGRTRYEKKWKNVIDISIPTIEKLPRCDY